MNGKAPLAAFCGEGAQECSQRGANLLSCVCFASPRDKHTHSGRLYCAGEGPWPLQGNLAHPCSICQFCRGQILLQGTLG